MPRQKYAGSSASRSKRNERQFDPLQKWLSEIDEVLKCCSHHDKIKAATQAVFVESLAYDSAQQQLRCSLGGRWRGVVCIDIDSNPLDPELFLDPSCECPYALYSPCLHITAAFLHLQKLFSKEPVDRFVSEVLQLDKAPWEIVISALDDIVTLPTEELIDDKKPESATSRLIWRLKVDLQASNWQGSIGIEPVMQLPKSGRGGGWTKGKVISWDRIADQEGLAISLADLDVVRAAGSYHYRGQLEPEFVGAVFEALIGNPLVFYEQSAAQVRRGELGIGMHEENQGWRLEPTLDGLPLSSFPIVDNCSEGYVVACHSEKTDVIVAKASQQLIRAWSRLTVGETLIPPEGQAEVIKRLPDLESRMSVNLPASLKGELVTADTALTLRVHPELPEGAIIDLRMLPAPGGGYVTPGQGPIEIRGTRGSDRVCVERDLTKEVVLAKQLADDLFLNRFQPLQPQEWKIPTDEEVLDLLDVLRARPEGEPIVAWSEGSEMRRMTVLGEVSASSLKIEIKDRHDWFGLSGSIELGGQQFPLPTLLSALRDGRKYIALGKGQFASIAQAFRDRLAAVSDMLHQSRGHLEFNATAAPVISELLEDQLTAKVSRKWKQTVAKLNRATDLDPVIPGTLTAELRDYQSEGFKWMRRLAEWGVGGILADDMGLGKTVQALAVLIDRRSLGPSLVVAPVSVGFNWERETQRFAPTLRPILYRETDRNEFLKTLSSGDLLITSYYLAQQHSEELASVKWGTLVLDEAQCVKNSQTKTAQGIREIEADWRLALTGTPCENHLGDLWSVFRAVSPGLFGSWERFREVFAEPIEKGHVQERKQALSRVLRPFVLRRTKSEVLKELPNRTEIQLTAELSKEERKRYEDVRLWAATHLTNLEVESGKDQRFQVLAALTKLRQLACHPRLVDESWDKSSAKLDLFLETIDELREGKHRALVFSQFTSHLGLIREALDERKVTYQYLDGQTTPKQRQERVDAFQNGEGEFFLISLKAGGTGLNLTAADYVIHLDPWWNPAVEDQATDRAHRIGQTRPVTVYRLVAKDTIEEQILKLHADKRHLVAGILEGTDQAAKLSTRELIDLIKSGGLQT